MKTPVSIALFFLLSAFFLFALLAALQRSRKALGIAAACLVAVVCTIVFLTPVRWPNWLPPLKEREGYHRFMSDVTTTTVTGTVTTDGMTATTVVGATPVMDPAADASTTDTSR